MATQNPPYVIQSSAHSAKLFRQAFSSMFSVTLPGTLTSADGGVNSVNELAVSQNSTPNMSINIAGGSAWIPQTIVPNGGMYFALNDATVNISIAPADLTNPRIDIVCASVADSTYAGTTNAWSLSVVQGTPTSGASLSNIVGLGTRPGSSITLGYVLVPANATSIVTANISDQRKFLIPGISGNPAALVSSSSYVGITSSSGPTASFWTGGFTIFSSGGITANTTGLVLATPGYYLVTASGSLTQNTSASSVHAQVVINSTDGSGFDVYSGSMAAGASASYNITQLIRTTIPNSTLAIVGSTTAGTTYTGATGSKISVSLVST